MTENEQTQRNVEEFARLQKYMRMSDKEFDVYKEMSKRYKELKVILSASGINLTEIDYSFDIVDPFNKHQKLPAALFTFKTYKNFKAMRSTL